MKYQKDETLSCYCMNIVNKICMLSSFPPFCRLGWLIRFISHSVISGFTTSSAIVIALSQAKYFLGYEIVKSSKIVPLVKSIISGINKV